MFDLTSERYTNYDVVSKLLVYHLLHIYVCLNMYLMV